jgi:hypothetical protein
MDVTHLCALMLAVVFHASENTGLHTQQQQASKDMVPK